MMFLDTHIVNFSEHALQICKCEAVELYKVGGVGVYRIFGETSNIEKYIRYLWARVTYVEADKICAKIAPFNDPGYVANG